MVEVRCKLRVRVRVRVRFRVKGRVKVSVMAMMASVSVAMGGRPSHREAIILVSVYSSYVMVALTLVREHRAGVFRVTVGACERK